MQEKFKDNNCADWLVFSSEVNFHINDKVKKHKLTYWVLRTHMKLISICKVPNSDVFCPISKKAIYGLFFAAPTVNGGNITSC